MPREVLELRRNERAAAHDLLLRNHLHPYRVVAVERNRIAYVGLDDRHRKRARTALLCEGLLVDDVAGWPVD